MTGRRGPTRLKSRPNAPRSAAAASAARARSVRAGSNGTPAASVWNTPSAPAAATIRPETRALRTPEGTASKKNVPFSRVGPRTVRSVCHQTPEVGAVCLNRARTVLCGGRSAMSVPTAIAALAMTAVRLLSHSP
jgi:hypothetical protein